MRILILNWRDIKNPTSGGAEILTHEMAKRWVKKGHVVTQFSSYFPGARITETIDGIKFIRQGKSDVRYFLNSVHFAAFRYFLQNRGLFDVIIDEVHGIPFFTPFYVRKKKVVLICEVAGRIWDVNFSFPFNILGKFVEKNYFNFYKNIDFLTISNSTKNELIKLGVSDKRITVLPMGITTPKSLPVYEKEKTPTLIFVARLLKAKGIEDAIKACALLKKEFPRIKLWVIGKGEKNYEKYLKKLVKLKKIDSSVRFFGFVTQSEKFKLMQRAHLLVVPSIKEGFGLTIPEAGLVGTPAVAYDVEGLRDIINDGHNGLLVKANSEMLSKKIKELILDNNLYKKIQKESIKIAKELDWNNTAEVALELLK